MSVPRTPCVLFWVVDNESLLAGPIYASWKAELLLHEARRSGRRGATIERYWVTYDDREEEAQ